MELHSLAAKRWVRQNVYTEPWQWHKGESAVSPMIVGTVDNVAEDMYTAGLMVLAVMCEFELRGKIQC